MRVRPSVLRQAYVLFVISLDLKSFDVIINPISASRRLGSLRKSLVKV